MEFLTLPLTVLALAFLFNGFPNLITINKHYHYDKNTEKKEDA